ncbi:hypothetical protein BDR04DRAFT_1156055, partial [Suillus decipiens]
PPKSQKKDEKDEKKIVKKIVKKEVISLVSSEVSDARSGSEKPEDDDKAKSDSDYEDDSPASKKRKAKSETTLRASKKRASPAEPPLPKAGNPKSMKGKGKARAEKSKQPSTVESSDDEEAPNVIVRAIEQPAKRLRDGPKVREVPKASAEPNDAEGTTRGSEEAPASTEPVAVAGHVDSERNDADGTARGSAEAPASTEPAATAGHPDSVPVRSLPPLSPSQIRQQIPSLPENYIQTEPATRVVASNTLRTDPVHTDPTTRTASQDNTMHTDPIHSDCPPSLQPDLTPTLASNHGRSEPAMEIPHDQEVRPMYDPRPRGPLPPRYGPGFTRYPQSDYYHDPHAMHRAPQLPHGPQPRPHQHQPTHGPPHQPSHGPQPQYHNGGHHDAPYHDSRDGYDGYVDSYWHPPSSAYFGPGGRYQHGYGREYPNEYPEDLEDGGRAP